MLDIMALERALGAIEETTSNIGTHSYVSLNNTRISSLNKIHAITYEYSRCYH